jgi:CubicO group peptidase (beta-lactamase class C family)
VRRRSTLVPAVLLALLAGCTGSPTSAPAALPTPSPATRAAVESYLTELEKADEFSGVVLVAKDFVPFATKATGYSDAGRGSPNATGTNFNLSSITKLFTAVAIGQLIDQGKVGLDDPLTKYLPSYPKAAGDRITIAMLLAHTAGTGDYLSSPGYARVRDSFENLDELLAAVDVGVPAGIVPGAAYKYSNTGYLLLGAVIEKASGRDYYDYVTEAVLQRAGVAGGFLRNDEDERSLRGYALGYKPDGTTNWRTLPVRGTPAGGAYASAPDLLAFHRALTTGVLLRSETLRRLVLQPPPAGKSAPPITSAVFAGDDVGASAVLGMSDKGYTVVVLANITAQAQPVADHILKLIPAGS